GTPVREKTWEQTIPRDHHEPVPCRRRRERLEKLSSGAHATHAVRAGSRPSLRPRPFAARPRAVVRRKAMSNRTVGWVGSVVVLLHALIGVGHAVAHRKLGIAVSGWQAGFIALVIGLGPFAAATLLWTSRCRLGAWILGSSMSGSLFFGTYSHYIATSADHVGHLPPGDLQALFRWTALLLAITELLGLSVSLWAIRRMRPAREGGPGSRPARGRIPLA
ncbi:MAG: hypothetical protein ACRD3M_17585, partial [Thermoanaerobaculia bacterium]